MERDGKKGLVLPTKGKIINLFITEKILLLKICIIRETLPLLDYRKGHEDFLSYMRFQCQKLVGQSICKERLTMIISC